MCYTRDMRKPGIHIHYLGINSSALHLAVSLYCLSGNSLIIKNLPNEHQYEIKMLLRFCSSRFMPKPPHFTAHLQHAVALDAFLYLCTSVLHCRPVSLLRVPTTLIFLSPARDLIHPASTKLVNRYHDRSLTTPLSEVPSSLWDNTGC